MREVECAACGEMANAATGVAFWVSTALGNCVLRTHRGPCEALAVTQHLEQPAKRIREPVGAEERADRAKKLEAAEKVRKDAERAGR